MKALCDRKPIKGQLGFCGGVSGKRFRELEVDREIFIRGAETRVGGTTWKCFATGPRALAIKNCGFQGYGFRCSGPRYNVFMWAREPSASTPTELEMPRYPPREETSMAAVFVFRLPVTDTVSGVWKRAKLLAHATVPYSDLMMVSRLSSFPTDYCSTDRTYTI